jgi:hypothetical protein
MAEDFALEFSSLMVKIVFAVSLMGAPALAQQTTNSSSSDVAVASTLPDAPSFQDSQNEAPLKQEIPAHSAAPSAFQGSIGPIPPLLTDRPMTFSEKFAIYKHQTFGPPALVFPAFGAGIRMANPPKDYPREWIDGGGAFGRLYGSAIATQTTKRTAKFFTESLFHEDPRYLPAPAGANLGARVFHAVAFTFVDRSDSGRRELAFANFTSATAGGFVGMAYLPDGFNDASHAGQRIGTEFLGIAIANISREFAPQWAPVARKLHLPKIVPSWWIPEHPQHP